MLAPGEGLPARPQQFEGVGHHPPGVGRIDDGVDEAPFGRLVRREEPLGVVLLERRPLPGVAPSVEDLDGSLAPMTAISAPGQAKQRSLPRPFESMTMYAPPNAFRRITQTRGTVASA